MKSSITAVAVLFAAFFIAAYNSLSVTSLSISDSDPAGYVIVPMLMLFVFILFSIKERLSISYKPRNIAYGAALAAVYFVVYAYANVSLSFLFETYRIDALMFPVLLSAFAVMLFGTSGLNRLKPAIIYSVFASPLLLMPLLNLSGAWTNFNAYAVFGVLKAFGIPVLRHGIIIAGASGSQISIASTCADIGAFIGMFLFLIPIAYVYYGKLGKKVLWVVFGMLLLFAFNIARMSLIAAVWAYSGTSAALNLVHLFVGQFLFDITLIAMILLAPKFSMYLNSRGVKHNHVSTGRNIRQIGTPEKHKAIYIIPVAAVFVLAILVFVFTLPLHAYDYVSPFRFSYASSNSINSSIISSYDLIALDSGYSMRSLAFKGGAELFGVYTTNDINTTTNRYLFINTSLGPKIPKIDLAALGDIYEHREIATDSGISINSYVTNANGKIFQLNYVSKPNKVFGNYTVANMEYVSLINSTGEVESCPGIKPSITEVYTLIYNALNGNFAGENSTIACIAYSIA